MSLLNASSLSFHYPSQAGFLFQAVTFEINPGDRIGLVGPNGSGKTSLLRLLAGELQPTAGSIARQRGLLISYVPQESQANSEESVEDYVFGAFAELSLTRSQCRQLETSLETAQQATHYANLLADYEARGGFQAESDTSKVLEGLGFDARERGLAVGLLSSGQRARAELARLLLTPSDLLLIDEPTNHLDLAAREWLEGYLVRIDAAYLMVSHDRFLLNQVTTRIFEIGVEGFTAFEGNYDAYREQRAVLDRQRWERYEGQQRRLQAARQSSRRRMSLARKVSHAPAGARHGKDFYGGKAARVARTARILRERAEREPKVRKPWVEDPIRTLTFPNVGRAGDVVLCVEGLSKAYDTKRLFHKLSFTVGRGERWAVTGPNGCGKTTLLRLLLGLETPDEGSIRLGAKVKLGYLAQQGENLDLDRSAVAVCRDVHEDETWVRTILGCLRLRGERAEQPVGAMSLGERCKVALARLLLSGANVLLLDEPTNHLDIEAHEAVEETLEQFPGTILFVSHDRYFLKRLAQKTLRLPLHS
ncbi:MAG: ribosomal protection-like ABC-F family protein [Acidobacteriota bacterium]